MKIALNVWFLDQPTTGSGQYVDRLLARYAERHAEHQFLLCAHASQANPYARQPGTTSEQATMPAHFQWAGLRTPFDRSSRHLAKLWFEQFAFPAASRHWGAHVIHVPYWASPAFAPCPVVVTVHDLIPALLPAYRGGLRGRLYTSLVSASARRATAVLTDSEASRQDIIRHLGIPAERVRAVPLAADQQYSPARAQESADQVRAKYGLPPRYLLYLGGFDVRKNVAGILQAFARLNAEDVQLVVAGKLPAQDTASFPDPRRVARDLGILGRVVFTGWVDELDKPALYGQALAFVFPSKYEGFGLPPLEALACGTPVITSDRSSLPKAVGNGGLCVDPNDADALAQAMHRLCTDATLRASLSAAGLRHAERFDWDQVAKATLEAYRQIEH